MDMDSNGHSHGMPMGDGDPAAKSHRHGLAMHMTFFWGKDTEILFHGWPGQDRLGMYILALLLVFLIAFVAECVSRCKIFRETESSKAAGLTQTLLYAVRVGLAYVVMLAVMSFNGGVLLAAVAGHGIGFFLFGSNTFNRRTAEAEAEAEKISDHTPINC